MNAEADLGRSSVVIMITAYNRDEILGRARDLGVRKVLNKPLTESAVHDCLMELFGRRRRSSARGRARAEEVKAIRGARILLVEDNEVNQLVASKILGNAGFRVAIASDGAKAVDLVRKEDFDLVLMDIQMPVMDGLSATRAIRDMGYDRIPIVAMTAHAMSSDRELSLKAGMNDHVNKPINVGELFQALAKWIPPRNPPEGAAGADEGDGEAEGAVSPAKDAGAGRPDKAPVAGCPDKAAGAECPDKSEAAERPDKVAGAERPDKAEGAESSAKAEGAECPDKAEAAECSDKAARAECSGESEASERSDKAAGAEGPDKAEVAECSGEADGAAAAARAKDEASA
jgi:CheY-like chemotaxis protein